MDLVLTTPKADSQKNVEHKVAQIAHILMHRTHAGDGDAANAYLEKLMKDTPADEKKAAEKFNYTRSRLIDRPQTQDIIHALFDNYVELRYVYAYVCVYHIPYTISHSPHTTHYTLDHTPYTIHHTPYTIHHTP
ncbi:hypothetical protein EON63_02270 [archaeon]|nr:MAG: hypothetical protein EON63_02270 [archaeon]